MSLLFRVIARTNAAALLPALLVGVGIYLLTDLFERLDNFISAELGAAAIALYFAYKLPLIISQILPVVFLLACVIQLCLMSRARELTALYAGGVSPLKVMSMLFACGLFWGVVQFGFSQWIGAYGEQQSLRMWQEQVRKRNLSNTVLRNIWFTENAWIVSLGTLRTDDTGDQLLAYRLSEDGLEVEDVVRADTYRAVRGAWELNGVEHIQPSRFSREELPAMTLSLRQNLESFRVIGTVTRPQNLSILQLGQTIESLKASGSNVEELRTAWHAKISYAASLAVLTLVAMAIAAWRDNIYIATGMALFVTFLYYALHTMATTIGQQGILPPFIAAWFANFVAASIALSRLWPLVFAFKRAG